MYENAYTKPGAYFQRLEEDDKNNRNLNSDYYKFRYLTGFQESLQFNEQFRREGMVRPYKFLLIFVMIMIIICFMLGVVSHS